MTNTKVSINGISDSALQELYVLLKGTAPFGGTISNSTSDSDHDIVISDGIRALAASGNRILSLNTELTKRIDANWSEGTNQGMFPSGLSLSTNTSYSVYLIEKNDGTIDVGCDTSTSAVNLLSDATDYVEYAYIGSIHTDGSSNILGFIQLGNYFMFDSQILEYSSGSPGTAAISVPITVPDGRRTIAHMSGSVTTGSRSLAIFPTESNGYAPSTSGPATIGTSSASSGTAETLVWTNQSQQINIQAQLDSTITVYSIGYYDFVDRE